MNSSRVTTTLLPSSEGESRLSAEEIDRYLHGVTGVQRDALARLRMTILRLIPDVEQCISYRVPAFRIGGGVVAGFAAFKNHLSYLPFGGSVFGRLSDEIGSFINSKSALRFTTDHPLSDERIAHLIETRLEEIRSKTGVDA